MKKLILAFGFMICGTIGSVAVFSTPVLADDSCDNKGKILTFKPWYSGLTDSACDIKLPAKDTESQARFVWRIGLNVLDSLFQVVGYIAVGYIMYGGFLMMGSLGSSDKAARSRKTILNAVIGLVITIVSLAIVNVISSTIGIK